MSEVGQSLTMHVLLVDPDRNERKAASKLLRHTAKKRSLQCRIDRSPPEEVAMEALMEKNYHFIVLPAKHPNNKNRMVEDLRRVSKSRYLYIF